MDALDKIDGMDRGESFELSFFGRSLDRIELVLPNEITVERAFKLTGDTVVAFADNGDGDFDTDHVSVKLKVSLNVDGDFSPVGFTDMENISDDVKKRAVDFRKRANTSGSPLQVDGDGYAMIYSPNRDIRDLEVTIWSSWADLENPNSKVEDNYSDVLGDIIIYYKSLNYELQKWFKGWFFEF